MQSRTLLSCFTPSPDLPNLPPMPVAEAAPQTSDQTIPLPEPKPGRLVSLDALRGFDMFWIIGADALVTALRHMSSNPLTNTIATQLEHVKWSGFHFEDLIFPLFVF